MKKNDGRRVVITICTVISVIFVAVFFFFTIVTGISELSAKPADPERASRGDVIEYRVLYAKEVLEIKHMLFGVIPTYSERFYITSNEDGINDLVIRADEKWFEDNFTSDGLALEPIKISALIKSAGSKNGFDITGINDRLETTGYINTKQYADAEYISEATLKIISGILLLTAFITFIMMIILYKAEVLVKGGIGGNIMAIAAIIQMAAFIIIMFAV